jgi:hypothetical protein
VTVLITDDPDGAVDLLTQGLRSGRVLDSPAHALSALARSALRRPRWSTVQVLESLDPAAPTDDDAVLADALRSMPDRIRAMVVLHLVGGLPPAGLGVAGAEVDAAVAAFRDDLARRDETEWSERARAAAPFRRPGSIPEAGPPPPDLPERLGLLAAGRPLPATAVETVVAAIASAQRARRRRRWSAAAGALAAGMITALLHLLPPAPVPPGPVSVYAGPTRGSLAGDEDFLRAVRDSGWELAAGTTGSRRVVFAGDVPGGRWALLAAGGSSSRPATTAWFVGPPGAAPDRLALLSVRVAPDPAEPVSVTDPATGALVVVDAPEDRIRVSPRPYVDVGGSVSRSFFDVPTSHGVAVVGLPPVRDAAVSAVRLDMARHGRRLDVHPPTVVDHSAGPVDVQTTPLRTPAPPAAGDGAVPPRVRSLLGQLGEPVGDTPVTALWSGDLPGPNDQPARLTILAVPQTSGAVVVSAPYGYTADLSGGTGSSWCGTGVLPAGLPLDQRVVAVRCDLSDLAQDAEISRFLVVVGPQAATSMRLLDGQGAVLREQPLDDGVAIVRSPGDVAQVVVTMADGERAEGTPLVDADLAD